MTTYARIENNTAIEVFVPPAGFTLADCFHPELAALFIEVPDGTQAGATLADGIWTNAPPVVVAGPPAAAYTVLTPMQFYLAFQTSERMLLKALATTGVPVGSALVSPAPTTAIPVDPVIAEFWSTYQMAVDTKASIDPNLPSIQEALQYLATPASPTPAVILEDRIPEILAGVAQ